MLKKASTAFLAATVLVVLSLLAQPGVPVAADEPQSEYWAVIVGVAEYQAHWIQDLVGFDANARGLSQLLSPAWGEDHVRLLLNSEATKANVLEAVNWLVSQEDNDDAVLFYFAGHGIPEYIAPHDADNLDTFISTAELKSWLGALDSEKVVVIIDSCNAGSFNTALSDEGRVVLMSSQTDEKSYTAEFGNERSGLFSYYILDALNEMEAADADGDHQISAEEIFGYAETRTIPPTVQWYAQGLVSNIQHPVLSDRYAGELSLLEKFVFNTEPEQLSVAGTIIIDNETYSVMPFEFNGVPGSVHQLEIFPLYSGAEVRYVFTSWDDGDTSVLRTISQGGIYTALFDTQYHLTVVSDYGEPSGGGWYDSGAAAAFSITLIEEPTSRHTFQGWSGDFTGATETATVTMDSPKTVTAEWRTEYLLSIESAYGDPVGEGWYESGSMATIPIPATEGMIIRQVFTGWSGDFAGAAQTVTVPMNSPKVITANWKTDYVQLYMLIAGLIATITGISVTIRMHRKRAAG